MCSKCYILTIGRKFDVFNPKRFLSRFGFAEFGLCFIYLVQFAIEKVDFSLIICHNNDVASTLLPIEASHLLFHLEKVLLFQRSDIIDAQSVVISTSKEVNFIWRPALSPKLFLVMGS